jgi:hypothetical protein|tara:strand:- start:11 stop:397 length:387 start_codon:yes stop_codon:yes gene_type:complete
MATNATWTVIFDDKKIIKQSGDAAGPYEIVDNDFWGLAKWNNIWAIQYGTPNPSDTVEYRDDTPHSTWEDANLGDFQDFITRWDSTHLARLQSDWDDDNVIDAEGNIIESESDKIARLGARPTSYSSS